MLWQSVRFGCQFDPQTIAYFLAYRGITNAIDLNVIRNNWLGHEGFPFVWPRSALERETQVSWQGDRLCLWLLP
jgi:hypothetical protein